MSKLTRVLNKSTSYTADLFIALAVGCAVAVLVAILPLNWVPFVGPHLPGICGGLVAGMILERQRRNLKAGPAKFDGTATRAP